MRTKNRLGRAVALTTVVGAMASVVGFMPSVANADLQPGQTISVTSGNATTAFALGLTSPNNVCQGSTAVEGHKWSTYVAASSVDLNALTTDPQGVPSSASGFVAQVFTSGGDAHADNTSTVGQPINTNTVSLELSALPGNGTYNIGYFCYLAGQETRHWITPITVSNYVSPTNFTWAFGAVPVPPAPLTAEGGNLEITGTVTRVVATPVVTAYQITATPVGGGAAVSVTVPQAATPTIPFTISGLVNGTTYNITALATNAAGDSDPVAPPIQATPSLPFVTPAPAVSVTSGPSPVAVSWTPSTGTPLASATLVSHSIAFTPIGSAAALAPVTVAAGTNTTSVTCAAGDSYSVTVRGNYSNNQVTRLQTPAPVFSCTNAQVLVQDITVVRPQGALVLTQRCGVHGSAPAYSNALFGAAFPALDQTPGADPDGVNPPAAVGTAPIADALPNNPNSFGTGSVGTQTAGQPDGLFGQYPYPVDASGNAIATYATNCAVNLGTASLITAGPNAGSYFRATGRIAQLTVVDTRNTDAGWTLNGRMGTFSNGTDSFSGNFMGWVPEVTWDSNPNLDGYNTTATAGNTRLPQPSASTTGLGAAFNSTNTDLANSLAKANAGAGLGMAVMDARLNLLIPVTADAGTYKGVLTFTIV